MADKRKAVDNNEESTVRINEDQDIADFLSGSQNALSVKYGASSIVGTREYQQDTLFVEKISDVIIAVVCDGMGGLVGGEKASQAAVKRLIEDFSAFLAENRGYTPDYSSFLYHEAVKMDQEVYSIKDDTGGNLDCGTTSVVAIIDKNEMYWMSVGDSKIYLIKDKQIKAVNREHTVRMLIDELMMKGEISDQEYAEKEKQAEALISYLGMGNINLIDVNKVPIQLEENDIVILCSDGLYKRLSEKDIAEIISYDVPDLSRAARHLNEVVMRRTKHSQDNTSIILMQYNKY